MSDKLPEIDPEKLMSVKEVANILRVTTRTVQRLAKHGAFPHSQQLGQSHNAPYAIPWGDVLDYLSK